MEGPRATERQNQASIMFPDWNPRSTLLLQTASQLKGNPKINALCVSSVVWPESAEGEIESRDMSNRNAIHRGLAICYTHTHVIFATPLRSRLYYYPICQMRKLKSGEDTQPVIQHRSQEFNTDTLFHATRLPCGPPSRNTPRTSNRSLLLLAFLPQGKGLVKM